MQHSLPIPATSFDLPAATASGSWLSRRPITFKLSAIVLVFVGIIIGILTLGVFTSAVSTGVRAHIRAEGLWSKGQKDAVYYLTRYARSRDPQDYKKYVEAIAIPQGNRAARMEMEKPVYDYATVERGFVQGGSEAGDVPFMIFVFRRLHWAPDLAEAIRLWTAIDEHIAKLMQYADEMHAEVDSGALTAERADELLNRIESLNARLAPLEHEFSAVLGDGSRSLRRKVLTTAFSITGLLLAGGLWVAWRIAQNLRTGILNLREGALRVAQGDLDHLIAVPSHDELGELAKVFNDMIVHRREAEAELKARAGELARSNAELERFAYVASHDLQEPLRTVTSYTQLLTRRFTEQQQSESAEFMGFITEAVQRMRALIEGLLSYSKVASQVPAFQPVDLNQVLDGALANLRSGIESSGASISSDRLPELVGDGAQLIQVFQNLIGNALKFRGTSPPVVKISAVRDGDMRRISVSDNGIGIDPQYAERIFELFQRLHPSERYPGSGLGLAICQKIVERHGGRIWVEPAATGSVFHFTLRASGPAAA